MQRMQSSNKLERSQFGIDHATYDLLTRQYTKTPELAACAVEMNLTWKLNWNRALDPVL